MRTTLVVASVMMLAACWEPSGLTHERGLDDGASFGAYLVSYKHAGLKLHAMIAVPNSAQPEAGYPVVVANHGYVPDPTKYGITADGVDSRPGDYYRSVPELYTSRGFLVVMPDYRGHNSSEGFEQIEGQNREAINLYADDVIALLALLGDIENVNLECVFMWGHSMGGAVTMRVLLATDRVKAASFWSTMPVDDLPFHAGDPGVPVMIQHSLYDQSTAFGNSEKLAEMLAGKGQLHFLHHYDSADHYFAGEMRELAADRDAEFFDNLTSSP